MTSEDYLLAQGESKFRYIGQLRERGEVTSLSRPSVAKCCRESIATEALGLGPTRAGLRMAHYLNVARIVPLWHLVWIGDLHSP